MAAGASEAGIESGGELVIVLADDAQSSIVPETIDDGGSAIGGAVVDDDQLERGVSLAQDTRDGFGDERFAVENGKDDGDETGHGKAWKSRKNRWEDRRRGGL